MASVTQERPRDGQVVQSDVRQLLPLLTQVYHEWDQFALSLPLSYPTVQEIKKRGQHTKPRAKLTKVLMWYASQRGERRWEEIVRAIQDIRNYDLAGRIPQSGKVPVSDPDYINKMLDSHCLNELVADWKSFGMQLGVSYSTLESWDAGNHTPRGCMEQVLIEWIKYRGREANVSDIVKACERVGNYALAEQLERNEVILEIQSRTAISSLSVTATQSREGYSGTPQHTPQPNDRVPGCSSILWSNSEPASHHIKEQQQGVDKVANRVIKSCQTKMKDVILSAGLTNIIYHCEEKDLITESVKSTLVSSSTGQTEEQRAYQLVDAIRKGLTLSTTLSVMDELLCILHTHAARTGQALSRNIAEQFPHYLPQYNTLITSETEQRVKQENSRDATLILDKTPLVQDVLSVLPKHCDTQQLRSALSLPSTGSLHQAIHTWITQETSTVTWRCLVKALSSSPSTAQYIVSEYLTQPEVSSRYIDTHDFESFDSLGLL